jgi:hypothetical protein
MAFSYGGALPPQRMDYCRPFLDLANLPRNMTDPPVA